MRLTTSSFQDETRRRNISVLLNDLRLHGPFSRSQLAKRSGLTKATVSVIVDDLVANRLVMETDLIKGKGAGRPARMLTLDPGGGSMVGVKLWPDAVLVILTNFLSEVIWEKQQKIREELVPFDFLKLTGDFIDEALREAESLDLTVYGIGVGVPALIDKERGVCVHAPNMHWNDVHICQILEERFDYPIYLENDANVAAMAEYYYGVAQDINDFIYIHFGHGVGGGIYVNGHLLRGHTGFGGEIGHVLFQGDLNDQPKSDWEQQLSIPSMRLRLKQIIDQGEETGLKYDPAVQPNGPFFEQIVAAAEAGDEYALAEIDQFVQYLGLGVANLVNIFNPAKVVLGGYVKCDSDWLLQKIHQVVSEFSLKQPLSDMELLYSSLETDASVIGSAILSLDSFLSKPVFK
jgi:predicted NBD/HSP70 family sugar kinase